MGRTTERAIDGINGRGIAVSWKTVLAVLTVLLGGGGGGYAVRQYVTAGQVDQKIEAVKASENVRHEKLDRVVDGLIVTQEAQGTKLEQVSRTVGSIQAVQHRQIARDEARRVTKDIRSRNQREEAYDRIREVNLSRLKRGAEPCGSLECTN